ncbi:hypothetical protein [Cytobacillus firmus]|uniref:hypothetical protein n=1 Tax=Cytobacillus firmus TaxID=1399 RepID=UPI001C8E27D4|nr:hypothetical protein [Cytobacillus firmus]MBX9972523.1 hypothetical protein [Cytobacillus firmus]
MELVILAGEVRGYITEGDMYSNGKQIRLLDSIGLNINYRKIINGEVQNELKQCKVETFEYGQSGK